jgi:hypothetical protein
VRQDCDGRPLRAREGDDLVAVTGRAIPALYERMGQKVDYSSQGQGCSRLVNDVPRARVDVSYLSSGCQ